MSQRRAISLIVGLLLIACLAQGTIAASDGTGNETADQVVITTTPTITVAPEPTVNGTSDQVVISPTPTAIVAPEPAVVATVEPTTTEATPVPTATPEPTVVPIVEPAVTEGTPVPTEVPEVTVVATVEPAVTEGTPVPTEVPEVTVVATVEPDVTAIPEATPEPVPAVNTTLDLQGTDLAPVNPAFSHYLDLTRVGKMAAAKQGYALGYIPPSVDLSHLKGKTVAWSAVDAEAEVSGTDLITQDPQSGGYPSVYDLRTVGKVTPVRDQGACGACWAFATYGSLESTLLPRETWDFSENSMLNTNSYDVGRCDGGSDIIAMAYLARWSGPVNEKADPYTIDALYSPTDLKTRKHAQEMLIIPPRMDYTGNNNLKAAIMNYGGVYSAMYWDDASLNTTYAAYYAEYPDYMANHAITLVGWDDTFSRNKFLTNPVGWDGTPFTNDDGTLYASVPQGDGAFIAKNSWGTGFGDNGFFYISYYDPMIGFTENTVFTAEPLKNLKQVYQYDDLGWVGNLGTGDGSDTAWFANVFRSTEKEQVAAVAFYTTTENSEYTVSVYTDPTDGPMNSAGPVATKIGSFELAGYHTVIIDPPVPVDLAQRFSIVVKLRTPDYRFPIPLEIQIPGYTSNVLAHPGESYDSADGSAWTDITTIDDPVLEAYDIHLGNAALKAFAVPAVPPPDARFTATPKKGKLPLKVTFKDRSLRRPASWLWDFGDGTTSTEQNPIHTYTRAGAFMVNLTVKNNGGEDFTSKESYITVGEAKGKARPYYDFRKKDDDNTPPDR